MHFVREFQPSGRPAKLDMKMGVASWLVVLTFVCLIIPANSESTCPTNCTCAAITDAWTYETEFTVDCSEFSLTTLPSFLGVGKIDKLNLDNNKLSVLPNGAFRGVSPKKITLLDNMITTIENNAFVDVAHVTTELDLAGNKLSSVPAGIRKLTALKNLRLQLNRNTKITRESFQGLRNLEMLDLSQCGFTSIPFDVFDEIGNNLKELLLSYNKLTRIPEAVQKLTVLEKLDFDSNDITSVHANAFKGMTRLQELVLSRNDLAQPDSVHALAFVDIANTLEDLDFYHSNLVRVPTEAISPLKKLKRLNFNTNNIRYFPPKAFQSLDSLTELILDGNTDNFTREMFDGIEDTLQMLSIRDNSLTRLPTYELQPLKMLQWIDASSNKFKILDDNFTEGLSAYRYTLHWMKIEGISPKAFMGKTRPIHLSLEDNEVKSLDFVVDPCDFDYVELEENPLVCDCHTLFVVMHSDVVVTGTCEQPSKYRGMDISSISFRNVAFSECKIKPDDIQVPKNCVRQYEDHSSGTTGLNVGIFFMLISFYTTQFCW